MTDKKYDVDLVVTQLRPNNVKFTFWKGDSEDPIFETRLTPYQLLQIFQYSGIDFHEDLIDIEKD